MANPLKIKFKNKTKKKMACLINGGVSKDCAYFVAGVANVYLGNYSEFTFNKNAGGEVSGITAISSATFYQFDTNTDSASANSELQVANGRKYFNQTVTFGNDSDTLEAKVAFEELGLAKVVAIVETKQGLRSVYGLDGGLEASALTFGTGAAAGDQAGWSVTLLGVGKETQSPLTDSVTIPV
jgi:hypothetical protein